MIYFVQAGQDGPIKIGYVEGVTHTCVYERMRLLQVGNHETLVLRAAMPGGLEEERDLHRQFAAGHLRGEWFAADTLGLQIAIDTAPNDEGVIAWQLRSDGEQLCEWCREGVVIPPRRSLCSDRCAMEKKLAGNKARQSKNPGRSEGITL